MPVLDYLFLVQNLLLLVLLGSTWILCKSKKKPLPPPPGAPRGDSSKTIGVKSAIKPPVTDTTASQVTPVKEEKKEEPPVKPVEEPKKEPEQKKETPKEENGGKEGDKEEKKEKSQQAFAALPKMTASKRNKKMDENEKDKQAKIKAGFFQEKSDEDDTLEKVDSLRVEQSDRTKRSARNKPKK